MNTEQLRADFEAWIALPPYERQLGINPEASGFPGQYRAYEVQLAWEAYQAGRAALTDAGQVQALLGRSLAVIQQYIDEIGGCDHSVGICCCELIQLADDILAFPEYGERYLGDGMALCAECAAQHQGEELDAMPDHLRTLIEGMSVSVDVSTGDHDAGHRYFGTVTEVMDDDQSKHGVTLLVQDAAPNFERTAQPAVGEEIMVNAAHDVYTLPLQPSGLSSGPRFVVHVPAPEQQPAADKFVATFRCESNGIVGSMNAPIHSVSMHDDGVVEVVIDHWPEQPSVEAREDAARDAVEQRDIAIDMLARWCVAVSENGAGWDDWDEHYKDAAYRPGPLRSLLDAAIQRISKESK